MIHANIDKNYGKSKQIIARANFFALTTDAETGQSAYSLLAQAAQFRGR